MRLHRFYIKEAVGDQTEVSIPDHNLIHQLKNVFRFNVGTQVVLFDNSGFEYLAMITFLQYHQVTFQILEAKNKRKKSDKQIFLFASLIKKDNFEWIIEKATELGIAGIMPVISERSEKKSLNMERGTKILTEASEQSGRVTLPILQNPQNLEDVIRGVIEENDMNLFVIHPEGKLFKGLDFGNSKSKAIGVFVGPEGGWSDRELKMFKDAKIPIYNIGSQILRAETAAIAVTSLLMLS
jgi:16S rRNA (uracil1498-N3)-methyltransferase